MANRLLVITVEINPDTTEVGRHVKVKLAGGVGDNFQAICRHAFGDDFYSH